MVGLLVVRVPMGNPVSISMCDHSNMVLADGNTSSPYVSVKETPVAGSLIGSSLGSIATSKSICA